MELISQQTIYKWKPLIKMKGNKMKDKITITIVCTLFIGMYLISRSANIASSNESLISEEIMPTQTENSTLDFILTQSSTSLILNFHSLPIR